MKANLKARGRLPRSSPGPSRCTDLWPAELRYASSSVEDCLPRIRYSLPRCFPHNTTASVLRVVAKKKIFLAKIFIFARFQMSENAIIILTISDHFFHFYNTHF